MSSDVPVTAGARVLLKDPDIFGDVLFLAAADPLDAPAVVPDNRTTKDLQTRLILSAPDAGATAVISGFAAGRGVDGRERVTGVGCHDRCTIVPPTDDQGQEGRYLRPRRHPRGQRVVVRGPDARRRRHRAAPWCRRFPCTTARLLAEVPEAFPDISVGSTN